MSQLMHLMLKVSQYRFPLVTHSNVEIKLILNLTQNGEIKWKLEEASRFGFIKVLKFSALFQDRNLFLEKEQKPDDGLWTTEERSKLFEVKDGKEIILGYYSTCYDHVETITAHGDVEITFLIDHVKDLFPELKGF